MKYNEYYNSVMNFRSLALDWSVVYYHDFKDVENYSVHTNWSLIKLLNKLMVEV